MGEYLITNNRIRLFFDMIHTSEQEKEKHI
jgi:hypothetical protein